MTNLFKKLGQSVSKTFSKNNLEKFGHKVQKGIGKTIGAIDKGLAIGEKLIKTADDLNIPGIDPFINAVRKGVSAGRLVNQTLYDASQATNAKQLGQAIQGGIGNTRQIKSVLER